MDDHHPDDLYFLRFAYEIGALKSKDPSTQTGAILVNPQNIMLAFGYNHLPWEMNDNQEIWNDREQKYQSVIHAEVDVISVAESYGHSTVGTTLYVPWIPCDKCAEAIITAGISGLVVHQELIDKIPVRWKESTNKALDKLAKAGVNCRTISGRIGGLEIRFDGELWKP
ncbi:MAG: deaminase [Nanoarchaeota archaeon]